jgi:hypothetical protein
VPLGEQRDDDVLEDLVADLDRALDVLRDAAGDGDGGVDPLAGDRLRRGLEGLDGFQSARHLHVGR